MTHGPIDIRVQHAPFDSSAELNTLLATENRHIGAIASFIGLVRDQPGAAKAGLRALHLQHYPGMTENTLAALARQAQSRFDLGHIVLIHRHGTLELGEPIVLVITASVHRQSAFAGAQFLMDCLKTDAPFWKCEIDQHGNRQWLDARDSDDQQRQRWSVS